MPIRRSTTWRLDRIQKCSGKAKPSSSMGFRFVPIHKVRDRLAQQMQVPQEYMNSHLAGLRSYCGEAYKKCPTGTVLTCFALRAGIARRKWEVVALKDQLHQLPSVPLWSTPPDEARMSFLMQLDGMSVASCLAWLSRRVGCLNEHESALCQQLRRGIRELTALMSEPFFMQAVFSARPLQMPYRHMSCKRAFCNMVAFHIIPDVHVAVLKSSEKLAYTPYSFIQCRQGVLECTPNDTIFRSRVHQEFASLLSTREDGGGRKTTSMHESLSTMSGLSKLSNHLTSWGKMPSTSHMSLRSFVSASTSSSGEHSPPSKREKNVVAGDEAAPISLPFGGIMVNSDVTVETGPKGEQMEKTATEVHGNNEIWTRGHASAAAADNPTFVDELFVLTVRKWLKL